MLVSWKPEVVRGPVRAALRPAVVQTQLEAIARARIQKAKGVRISIVSFDTNATRARLRASGKLASIFEGGRQGGYVIQPGLKTVRGRAGTVRFAKGVRASASGAIKFTHGDGGFYSGAGFLGGKMEARPYLHPAAASFPAYYRRAATAAFARKIAA